MNAKQVLNCQISTWYSVFEHLTFRTKLIDLPDNFMRYLVADGVFVSDSTQALPKRAKQDEYADENDYRDWSDDEQGEQPGIDQEFPELLAAITDAIGELNGAVVPKLNWSSPRDALWVTASNTLKCTNADEVLLLLKSSDRIAHDICHAFDACPGGDPRPVPKFQLALRKWYSLRPEREFRCFVREHDLIGVSQRHVTEHFPALAAQRQAILEALLEFFEEHLENRFPEPDYVFDVYVTTSSKVRLVDFNPVGGTTSALLFDWAELPYPQLQPPDSCTGDEATDASAGSGPAGGGFEFRIVTEQDSLGVRMPTQAGTLSGVPYDLVDAGDGGAVQELLARLRGATQDGDSNEALLEAR